MRSLSDKIWKGVFEKDLKFIIDFVKKNDDVFLGIRKDQINLYANGGSFIRIGLKRKKFYADINIENGKGYYKAIDKKTLQILSKINKQELTKDNIEKWNQILPNLKEAVKSHAQEHKKGNGKNETNKEKILQQKLALAFNNQNNPYFTYDIEYNIEGLKDYYYKKDGTIDKNNSQTLGRIDNMVISIVDNKIKLYMFEIKEGRNAIKNTNFNSKNKKHDDFGKGIIGHLNSYMTIIDCIKKNKPYISKYIIDRNKEKEQHNNYIFNIKQQLLEEIKFTMQFYQEHNLIKNEYFKNIDYQNLILDDVILVFYLGGYKNSNVLEEHLGVKGNNIDSVLNLINKNPMEYKYLDSNNIYDFKFYKDSKKYEEERTSQDLKIEDYHLVKVEKTTNNEVYFKII